MTNAAQTGGRLSTMAAAFVVARRDFIASLWSRNFIFFVIAPMFMVVIAGLAGSAMSGRFVRRPSRGRVRCPFCTAVAVRRVVHQERLEEPHAGLKQLGARVRGGRRGSERAATGHVGGPGEVLEAGVGGVSVESLLGCCEAPLKDVVMVLCLIAYRRDAGGAHPLAGGG